MPTFIEKLWDTASSKHNGIAWTPDADGTAAGTLTIEMGKRSSVAYRLSEFGTPWSGRAFRLVKAEAGGDPESNTYCVFVARSGRGHVCDCRGFAFGRGKPCKHVEACLALLENRWV